MKKIALILSSLVATALFLGCQVETEATMTVTNRTTSNDLTGFYIVPSGSSASGAPNQLTAVLTPGQSQVIYGISDCDMNIDIYYIEDNTTYSTTKYLTCGKHAYFDDYDSSIGYTEN